jgi:tetratricopeptide (TPR) repeat protein
MDHTTSFPKERIITFGAAHERPVSWYGTANRILYLRRIELLNMQILKGITLISCFILVILLSISSVNAVNSAAEDLVDKGTNEARQQRCDAALEYYDQALQIEPDYALAFYDRGLCLHDLGRDEEALASFDEALQTKELVKPQTYADIYLAELTWANRGDVLTTLGRYEEGIGSYDRALNLDQRDAGVWNNRGTALMKLGRYDDAISSFDTAMKITDMSTDYTFTIARKNRERALAEQKNATNPQQQIQQVTQPMTPEQPSATNPPLATIVEPTQKAPLVYAPIGALALFAGLFLWSRRGK